MHPSGQFLYVANDLRSQLGNSYVSVFRIDTATGALSQITGSPYQTGINTESVVVDPTGKFLFVINGGSNNVLAYTINATTGALTPVPGSPFPGGTNPAGEAVDPTGRFLYVSNNLSNNISAYTIDPSSGVLTPIAGSPFAAGSFPWGVAIDPTGHFLYTANRLSNNISAYTIHPNTGALPPLTGSPFTAGSEPNHPTIDPTGNFLYVPNFSSDNVSAYRISANTGALTPVPGSPFAAGTQPLWVAIVNEHLSPTPAVLSPTRGGNTGSVTVQIFDQGAQFTDNTTVRLVKNGQPDIVGTQVVSFDGETLSATFDLIGQAPGIWDVVITQPNEQSITLGTAFEIVAGGGPYLVLDIIGPSRVRVGRETSFFTIVRNEGLIDLGLILVQPPQIESSIQLSQTSTPQISTAISDLSPGAVAAISLPITFPSTGCKEIRQSAEVPKLEDLECDELKSIIGLLKTKLSDRKIAAAGKRGELDNAGCNSPLPPDPRKCARLRKELNSILQSIKNLEQSLKDACAVFNKKKCIGDDCRGIDTSGASQSSGGGTSGASATGTASACGVTSLDPNDKVGPAGVSGTQYVRAASFLPYTIHFENIATATAPAQEVRITDSLDPNLDWSTLALGDIHIGTSIVQVPEGTQDLTTTVDLRPANNLLVEIEVHLAPNTGVLTWHFRSIDPNTGQPPTDPQVGFLPPNVTPPEGEGSVVFIMRSKPGLSTGTVIRNRATITFDVNSPINTLEVINTIDADMSTSQVLPLAVMQKSTSFTVQWSGTDVGSGIRDYTLFVAEEGGPYTVWLRDTPDTSAIFTGQPGKAYAFYSVARDQAGNVEALKTQADATTQVVSADILPPMTTASATPPPNANGWNNTNVTVTLTAVDNPGGTGVKQIQFSLAGASSGTQVVNGSSAVVMIPAEGTTTLTYFASDNTGNQEAPKTLTVQIDKNKPVITGSRSPAPNATGWNNTNVTVSFSCADVGSVPSGIATNTVAGQTLSSEGAGQSVTNTGSCMDKAGNAADPATVSGINIDKTPPVITVSANPTTLWPPNGKMVPVTIAGTMTDAGSGVNASAATYAVTDEYGSVQPSEKVTLGANGSYSFAIQLEASRNGNDKDGRQYTITIRAQDNAGNSGSSSTGVTVPHDQGQ